MSLSIEEMRAKLLEWNPSWNVDKFSDDQVTAIYIKERNDIVNSILEMYS